MAIDDDYNYRMFISILILLTPLLRLFSASSRSTIFR